MSMAQGRMHFINGVTKQKSTFIFHHNLIIIPIVVNGMELNFILDTGASKTVIFTLNEKDSLVLNNIQNVELRGMGNGKPIQAILSEKNNIRFGNIMGSNQTIYMVYNEHFDFSSKVGMTIHGIIGYELLKDFVVSIDFNSKFLTFKHPEYFNPPKNKKFNELNLTFHHNKPYLDGILIINDSVEVSSKMLIDTGNSDAIWVFENKEKGVVCPENYFWDYLGEGLSGSIEGKRTKVNKFQFGDFVFKKPTIAFLDSSATSFARVFEDRNGSIGNQIINRFKIILDYPHQKIYLKKNNDFPKDFKYNLTGIEISYFGKTLVQSKSKSEETGFALNKNDNAYNIDFVINYQYVFKPIFGIYKIRKGSSAEEAGLKVNDMLYKINGKYAYEYEIDEINYIFQGFEGDNISLLVERNGLIYSYDIKLKEMF
jgi:hypothetical protein